MAPKGAGPGIMTNLHKETGERFGAPLFGQSSSDHIIIIIISAIFDPRERETAGIIIPFIPFTGEAGNLSVFI